MCQEILASRMFVRLWAGCSKTSLTLVRFQKIILIQVFFAKNLFLQKVFFAKSLLGWVQQNIADFGLCESISIHDMSFLHLKHLKSIHDKSLICRGRSWEGDSCRARTRSDNRAPASTQPDNIRSS